MKISVFSPPANIDDFDSLPNQRAGWSEFMAYRFDFEVGRLAKLYGSTATPQFYNPLRGNGATDQPVSQQQAWQGFPKVLAVRYNDVAFDFADALLTRTIGYTDDGTEIAGHYRQQDEYLEWHVERDDKSGKSTGPWVPLSAPAWCGGGWDRGQYPTAPQLCHRTQGPVLSLRKGSSRRCGPAVERCDLLRRAEGVRRDQSSLQPSE